MTTISLPLLSNKRECGTCTKCCEGFLSADIRGHKMFPGKPCFFVEQGVGCKDYENRPEVPCKNFACGWISVEDMPEEFKPDISGVITQYVKDPEMQYWAVSKAPENPSAQLLSWIISYALGNGQNVLWYIDDKSYWIGTEEFCNKMKEMNNDR
jgi:hypothetical protein